MCKCIDALIESGHLTTATSIEFETGKTKEQIVLGKLVEGKNGRLSVKPVWFLVQFCPNCGEKVKR